MSLLTLLGTLGTACSTGTIIPHVVHAVRNKKPSGSPIAWTIGTTGSSIWMVYGIASGDFLVGAPGIITIPCGLLLSGWSIANLVGTRRRVAPARLAAIANHPSNTTDTAALTIAAREWAKPAVQARMGDTQPLPRIGAGHFTDTGSWVVVNDDTGTFAAVG